MELYDLEDDKNEYRGQRIIRKKVRWVIILSLVLAILVMLFFLLDGPEKAGEYFVATPTPTPASYREVTPTPTPEETEAIPTPLPTETPTPAVTVTEGIVLTPFPTEGAAELPDIDFTPWVADETKEKEEAGKSGFIPISELFPNLSTYFKRDAVKGIELDYICQNPELPSGCESVALAMVLNYYGFGLKKTDICDKYMIYGDNFVTSFAGNPYKLKGGAIFAPGLVSVAEKILSERNSSLIVRDMTGTDLDTLIRDYVYRYVPVILYCTVDFVPVEYYENTREYNGKTYNAVKHGHCTVISGYDEEDGTCIVYDPISGVVKIPKEKVESVFNDFYKMAVVIE